TLESEMAAVRTLSEAVRVYRQMPEEKWKEIFSNMYAEVFREHHQYYGIWDSWELSNLDKTYTKSYGRYSCELWRDNGIIKKSILYKSMDGDPAMYARIKNEGIESIEEPYLYSYTGNKNDEIMMTSLSSPILENKKFIGVVGVDISCERFQKIVSEIHPFPGSNAFLLSYNGLFVGHSDRELIGKSFSDVNFSENNKFKVLKKIKEKKSFKYIRTNKDQSKSYVTYVPIQIGESKFSWTLGISFPIEIIEQKAKKDFIINAIVGILAFIILGIAIYFLTKKITKPIIVFTKLLNALSIGHIDSSSSVEMKTGDELEEMNNALNKSIIALNQKADFSKNIGKGNLNSELQILSKKDILGKSLVEMRNSLIKAKEDDELRKIEDNKRTWANEGLAKFADILRQNNDDIEELATQIIQNLVNYLDANQGGLFITNNENKEDNAIKLLSAFAFDRRKYFDREIEPGEGLIGTCAQEKKTIYMTDIPQDYIEITSGLGGANPNSLLIVPLKLEDTILGIIEIASFKNIEKYEIEFVEKLAESIASTLSSVRVNIRTAQLLEKSQQQAEEMAAQEEEMRQNMEELQATQEESLRKSAETDGLIEALNNSSYVIEYDLDGYIKNINDNYVKLLGITKEEIVGTHHSGSMKFSDEQRKNYDEFWNDLRNGKIRKETSEINVNGKQFKFAETYTPIRNADDEIVKILKISNNITEL
ncbi:MAG: cache domain-containing protein, partial [Bacteroidota bacterium]|nr:cache domain-containing protein [Bacteroidota bacterium]